MRLFILLFSLIYSLSTQAQAVEQQFHVANKSYQIGEYAVAIEQYEDLLADDYASAELYGNLGNAYYQFGDLGRAILNYERALRFDPDDETVQHNLRLARLEVEPSVNRLPEFAPNRWLQNMRQLLTANGWAILFLLLFWLALGAWVLWQLGSTRTQRKRGFIVGASLLLVALSVFLMAQSTYNFRRNSKRAIVLEAVDVRKGAAVESEVLQAAGAGLDVKLLNSSIQEWEKIQLPNGAEGWIEADKIEVI